MNVTENKWQKLSFAEQIGNIGSEISRTRHWEEMKDLSNQKNALLRAIELIDLTLADKRWRLRLKELTRLREVISDLIIKGHIYNIPLKAPENFCLDFAAVARKI